MKLSRFLSAIISMTLVSVSTNFLPPQNVSATTETILLGDVSDGGKSGGMTYFESTSHPTSTHTISTKSCVGICTHRVTATGYTRGIRLTTTVLRFLYQNSYLN